MQINPPSSQEDTVTECVESTYPLRCPLCNGSLVPLNSSYRCLRCCYHHCSGCEPADLGAASDG